MEDTFGHPTLPTVRRQSGKLPYSQHAGRVRSTPKTSFCHHTAPKTSNRFIFQNHWSRLPKSLESSSGHERPQTLRQPIALPPPKSVHSAASQNRREGQIDNFRPENGGLSPYSPITGSFFVLHSVEHQLFYKKTVVLALNRPSDDRLFRHRTAFLASGATLPTKPTTSNQTSRTTSR